MPRLSSLVEAISVETAFTVLARARELKAAGKDVVELEIGDSPYPSPPHARDAGIRAIRENQTGYCPSLGLPEFRSAAARFLEREFAIPAKTENIVVASGAKPFETYFADALLEPNDGVLVFSPAFPTYAPNIHRRGARTVIAPLQAELGFRPNPEDVRRFLAEDAKPRAIFLNSPHNPTGAAASHEDLEAIADLVRGTEIMILSDEPYCHMIWEGRHESILALPDMFDHVVAAYTFSKSYSMSGWRIGFAAAHPAVVGAIGKLINISASCSPPFVQIAAQAALELDRESREETMAQFREKVERLSAGLAKIQGIKVARPPGTFYVFPDVRAICDRYKITSHGLAMYFLEAADDAFGVACLGGESFGPEGAGFLRFSCAEPDERIDQAVAFIAKAIERPDRIDRFLQANPRYQAGRTA